MKPILIFLLALSLYITLVLFLLPYNNIDDSIVRKGSSLSSSYSAKKDHTYWLSPSGNFAFGFYPLCTDCDDPRYVVGIWLVKTENKTLVWVANPNDPPLNNLSSIFFDGSLILETKTRKKNNQISVEQIPLLPRVFMPAAYAKLYDNGNFLLYNYDSEIIWQSFDHPTNTILGGQQLRTGQTLLSAAIWKNGQYYSYTLGIAQSDGYIEIRRCNDYRIYRSSITSLWDSNVTEPVNLNLDATDGRLYVVDGNNVVLQNITQGDEHKCENDTVIYRGTMDPDGIFRLYKERIMGSQGGKSILLWDTRHREINHTNEYFWIIVLLTAVIFIMFVCFIPHVPEEKKEVGFRGKRIPKRI